MLTDVPIEIVVTGRALQISRAEQPLSVTVIDAEQLRSSGASGLEQVLQQVAGLQLFRRSDARSANATSQGVTLRALGGNAASRALLTLDGVPQTDPFGGWINWPAYDPLALAEVRVTRGGGSVTTGPGALAGAIELTSLAEAALLAESAVGSRGSLEGRVIASQRLGSGLVATAVHATQGDGFVPITSDSRGPADGRAPYRNATGRIRWVGPAFRGVELQSALSGFLDERSRGLAFSDNGSKGANASLRLVGRGTWQWSALGYAQWREFESSFAATDPDRTLARRTSLQYHVPGRALGWSVEVRPPGGRAVELRLGTDGRLMQGRSEELGSYINGVATRDRRSGGRTAHAGVYAEASWTDGPLLLTAGARIDRLHISSGSFVEKVIATGLPTLDVRYPARSQWLGTARGAGRLALGRSFAVRAASYLGWRPATLNELFRPFRLGSDATAANPMLKPEQLAGVEVGLERQGGAKFLRLTAFHSRISDPIANVTLGAGPGLFPQVGFIPAGGLFRQRQNLSAIYVSGMEAGGRWKRGPWSISADASWTRAKVQGGGADDSLSGLRPAQTPSLTAAASIAWRREPRGAALQFRYSGAQYEDDLNRIRLPAAFTVDGFAQLPLGQWLYLIGRVENIANAMVAAGRTADGTTERAMPRTFWLGLRILNEK